MDLLDAPIVYAGPTLSEGAIRQEFPDAIVRPPIQRGQLYRDRILRGAVFVILDGVFFQQLAISPREVLDVLADGACIVGASSMGALRAAECFPAGMLGAGVIYRMFRAGTLTSDDEVAVSFDPDRPERSTVALINVRYVARAALRRRLLDRGSAAALVSAAQNLFYAERSWPRIIAGAGVGDRAGLEALAVDHDLKRSDAMRALRLVRHVCDGGPWRRFRRRGKSFVPRDLTRELDGDPRFGRSLPAAKRQLGAWLLGSGRARSLLPDLDVVRSLETGLRVAASRALWDSLERSGALDAELYRYQAWRMAGAEAPGPPVLDAARAQLARAHGHRDWSALERALPPRAVDRLRHFSLTFAVPLATLSARGTRSPMDE